MSEIVSKKIFRDKKIRISKPKWLRKPLPSGPEYEKIRSFLHKGCLNTVCFEAKCPNQFECYSRGTATFLIMGDKCTRNCRFCSIGSGPLSLPDKDEPANIARAAKEMGLEYVVVTSVTRDDIHDGGASFFAEVIRKLKENIEGVKTEVLIPDFQGDENALDIVVKACPDVINHNVETIKRLYPLIRPEASYERSLEVLRYLKSADEKILIKSGLMAGLGETMDELKKTVEDIKRSGADFITIGQYLQPTRNHAQVERFVTPEEFEELYLFSIKTGFKGAASGPFVRSSYKASDMFSKN
ncbi:MAG: lipoyl synthase [Deltaproteobacteria bacterium]|nr:MAG: lipoyl synthase [Deltaproteobacteria bacterium]